MQLAVPQSVVAPELRQRRDRAERILNAVRCAVLGLLVIAALAYSRELPRPLNAVNITVLSPALAWALLQYFLWYGRDELPDWLFLANPAFDVTAVTAIIGGYALTGSGVLALRSPIFLMYFVVLAARPIASSARKAAFVAVLAVAEYLVLVIGLMTLHRILTVANPIDAVRMARITPLDEAAKMLFLAVGGYLAVYATQWVENLVAVSIREAAERQRVANRLLQAELDSLRLQLNPHFLFNALNGAIALIGTDPPAAEKMISSLSEFLRLVLTTSSEQKVTLDREISLLDRYMDLQRARFRERIKLTFTVDPDSRRALVPSLLLQPLVENAITHGLSPRASGGNVWVSAHRDGQELVVRVMDDGLGPSPRPSSKRSRGTGSGLANVTMRLSYLYGDRQHIETGARVGGGFTVHIVMPFEAARLTPPAGVTLERDLSGVPS